MKFTVLTFDTIDSTNSEAIRQARIGADEGLCVVAHQQTNGRGRHGRTWVSARDAGLYFSIVLRPDHEPQFLPLITLMSGVAVHDTLEEFGINADIKWVNDLLVKEKKICGILAETTETDKGLAVIVGIGINLRSSHFNPEIAGIATAVEDESPLSVKFEEISNSLTKFLGYFYDVLSGENGPAKIIDEWRKRSTYFSGKRVRVVLENETVSGVTEGLGLNGALRLRRADGSITLIQAGDVERLRTAN